MRPPRERHVDEPLDMHDHGLARLENDVGLDRSRPAGHPLRRVAGAMIGDDEQVIDLRALHHAAERGMAPRVLGVKRGNSVTRRFYNPLLWPK